MRSMNKCIDVQDKSTNKVKAIHKVNSNMFQLTSKHTIERA